MEGDYYEEWWILERNRQAGCWIWDNYWQTKGHCPSEILNIGKEMAKKLMAVGIDSSEKLIQAGSKQAFL